MFGIKGRNNNRNLTVKPFVTSFIFGNSHFHPPHIIKTRWGAIETPRAWPDYTVDVISHNPKGMENVQAGRVAQDEHGNMILGIQALIHQVSGQNGHDEIYCELA
jgi:hypothetical protein